MTVYYFHWIRVLILCQNTCTCTLMHANNAHSLAFSSQNDRIINFPKTTTHLMSVKTSIRFFSPYK